MRGAFGFAARLSARRALVSKTSGIPSAWSMPSARPIAIAQTPIGATMRMMTWAAERSTDAKPNLF